MLLHNLRGPISFDYLKTVYGVLKETYEAACRDRSLQKTMTAFAMSSKTERVSGGHNFILSAIGIMIIIMGKFQNQIMS